MQRIVIVGVTGSGKTTLAAALAQRLALRHIEMDSIHWLPNWQGRDREDTRRIVDEATSESGWVIDGNYSIVRDYIWRRADTLVWLDYPLRVSMWRLFWRIVRRSWTRELLWGTNQDRFWPHFLTRDSLFLWAISSRRRHLREYPVQFQQPEHAHLNIVRLRSPRETEIWLAGITSPQPPAPDSAAHTSAPQAVP